MEFDFFRYDGNFFISYLPLLIFPFFSANFNLEKLIHRFLTIAVLINTGLYLFYFIKTGGGVLINPSGYGNTFNPLFIATNASGGFYSIMLTLSFSFYIEKKDKKYAIYSILFVIFLWGTASRGSMLGVVGGLSCYFLLKKKLYSCIYLLFSLIIIVQAIILINTYPFYIDNVKDGNFTTVKENFEIDGTKENNIYLRAFENWPRAIYLFSQSPLVGTGFGSANDIPFKFKEHSLINFNNSTDKVYNSSHAHHSFLHILGEEGILGFMLFILFWVNLFKYLISRNRIIPKSILDFLVICFFNLSLMSFTEHRITSPSNASPFILVLCLSIIYSNFHEKNKKNSHCSR